VTVERGERAPLGVRLIVTYKLVKAPLVLSLAVFLSANPRGALHLAELVVRELSEGSALFNHLARLLDHYLTRRAIGHAAMLAWLDGLVTLAEGILLWRGHAVGEWLVVLALGALVPFEIHALERHPSLLKLLVLALNSATVLYLAARRLRLRRGG
jgi:uncharacterized membrane protein (DUF2068 family)